MQRTLPLFQTDLDARCRRFNAMVGVNHGLIENDEQPVEGIEIGLG
jgi:hypothetical protein